MAVGVKLYVRYENLKHVVLDELLSEHDHAELDAQLDEAAWWSALWGNKRQRCTFTVHLHTHTQTSTSNVRYWTYLLHAIVSKDINIIPRPPSKPVCREDKVT